MTTFTAADIAARFGLELHGEGGTSIHGVATLAHAGPDQLSFLANPRYRAQLGDSRAGIVVLRADDAEAAPGTALIAKDPYTTFAKIAALFDIAPAREAGIHPLAVVDPGATVSPTAHVGAFVSIGAGSVIGDGCIIGTGSVIGEDCTVGAGSELIARVTLVTRVRLGQRVRIHPGAVLGADGFGLAMDAGRWIKVPQLGGVVVATTARSAPTPASTAARSRTPCSRRTCAWTTWCRSRTTAASARTVPSPAAPASPAAPRSGVTACSAGMWAWSATSRSATRS